MAIVVSGDQLVDIHLQAPSSDGEILDDVIPLEVAGVTLFTVRNLTWRLVIILRKALGQNWSYLSMNKNTASWMAARMLFAEGQKRVKGWAIANWIWGKVNCMVLLDIKF